MYIDRPKLQEEIRKSILCNNITYIYGYVGSGKTTICKECLKTYFNHLPIHIIYPYMPETELNITSFSKEIYVFEDCDYNFKGIIASLDYIS